LTTETRIAGLGIFPSYQFDLQARDNGKFDILFRNRERDGWGRTKLEKLFLLFSRPPVSEHQPEVYNLRHQAINFVSTYRWMRRSAAWKRSSLVRSGAIRNSAMVLIADLRSENWDIRDSFQGPAPLLASLNLRRESVGLNFASFESGRWRWSAGAELSHRDFRSVIPGVALTPSLLAKGYQLKQSTRLDVTLWHLPERRVTIDGGLSRRQAGLWSQPSQSFEKLQGSAHFHWFPQAQGEDYELQHGSGPAKTFAMFPLTNSIWWAWSADNDLWMRGHIGTRDGRKGSAPLGRNFFVFQLGSGQERLS